MDCIVGNYKGANCPNIVVELINLDAPNWGSHQRPDNATSRAVPARLFGWWGWFVDFRR